MAISGSSNGSSGDVRQSSGLLNIPSGLFVIRIFAIILLGLAIFWSFKLINYDFSFETFNAKLALAFSISAMVTGILSVLLGNIKLSANEHIPTLNVWLLIISVCLLLSSTVINSWGDPIFMDVSLLSIANLVDILIYAILVVFYMEVAHASIRFLRITEFAHQYNLTDFNVNAVIKSYSFWGPMLMVIVGVIAGGVILLNRALIEIINNYAPQFGASIELNSIYGVAGVIALVFVPLGIILTVLFGRETYSKIYKKLVRAAPETPPEEEERVPERTAGGQIIVR